MREQVHHWAEPLSEEQFWRNPNGYGNSAGHLVLHLTGNLSYYIGAQIAQTGYVRDRDREFQEPRKLPKSDVLAAFDRTVAMVIKTIGKQTPESWLADYSAEREPESKNRFAIFLRCAGHAYHHVGQLILLHKELMKDAGARPASA